MTKILDIGCGDDKIPGATGMDVIAGPSVDIVQDLDVTPWPFEDDTFDKIRAQDVLEHVVDFIKVTDEMWRVAKPGAEVEVRMPFMSSVNLATDPTHRRAATHRTFEYFQPGTPLGRYRYSKSRFTVLEFHYIRGYVKGRLGRALQKIDRVVVPQLEKSAAAYECYFAYLYPMHDIVFKLRAEK